MKNFLTKMQYQLNLQVKFIISTIGTLLLIIMGSYIVGLAILMCIITLLEKIPFSITYFFYFFLLFFPYFNYLYNFSSCFKKNFF